MSESDLFLRACRGEPTARPPVWVMRQAGRYLPEYRALRARTSFLDLCKTPALAVEATLQPIRRFAFDAAILFSDLLVPLEAMGLAVEFSDAGPVLPAPVRVPADLERLAPFDPAANTPFVAEAVRLARAALGTTPLIGFAGAPFTTATYAIEGGRSKRFAETKRFFYREPAAARRLLSLISAATARYLRAQIAAGVQAVQIFDSWLGAASVEDWEDFVLEPTAALVGAVKAEGVPVIYFPHGGSALLERVARVAADVYSVDFRLPLDEARARLARGGAGSAAVQGNLDPAILLGPPDLIRRRVADIVRRGERHGHVMNLGHGILPETPIESVEVLVRAVHE